MLLLYHKKYLEADQIALRYVNAFIRIAFQEPQIYNGQIKVKGCKYGNLGGWLRQAHSLPLLMTKNVEPVLKKK